MKNLKAPFLAFALILLNVSIVSAETNPPPPYGATARNAGTDGVDDEPEGGPGDSGQPPMPIDQNIMMLLIGGLALGGTVIYRNQIKKASN